MVRQMRMAMICLLLISCAGWVGCGALGESVLQGGEAGLRTLIDLLLTDFSNQVADALDDDEVPTMGDADGTNGDDHDDQDDEPPPDQTDAITFSSDVQPILNERCIFCHSPGGFAQMQGIPWDFREDTAFEDLINQPSSLQQDLILVVPGDAESSLMFLKVNSDAPPVGEMMPLGGPPLSNDKIELIRLWIEQGAIQNADELIIAGEMIYAGNNCSACHCDGAGGGCALDAPSLIGVGVGALRDHLTGVEAHSGGQRDLDDQELSALEAYLSSL